MPVIRLLRAGVTRFRGAFDDLAQAVRNFEVGSIPARVGNLVTFGMVPGSGILASLVGLAAMYFAYGWVQNVYLA